MATLPGTWANRWVDNYAFTFYLVNNKRKMKIDF